MKKGSKIAALVFLLLFLPVAGTAVVMGVIGDDKVPTGSTSFPWLEDIKEETVTFLMDSSCMIENGKREYFAVQGPGNEKEIALILDIRVEITWSDDDGPAVEGPWTYDNLDLMTTLLTSDPIDRNWSNEKTGSGTHGFIETVMVMNLNPGMIRGIGDTTWSISHTGDSAPTDATTHLAVHCTIGEDNYRNILYEDPGDEIDVEVSITYSMFPYDLIKDWVPK